MRGTSLSQTKKGGGVMAHEKVVCGCDECRYDFTVEVGDELNKHVHRDEMTGKLWVLCPMHLAVAQLEARAVRLDGYLSIDDVARLTDRPNAWGEDE